jgi:hypothetical protein
VLTRLCARRSSTIWGQVNDLIASGALAFLIASGAKLADQVMLINALDEGADRSLPIAAKRIGGRLLFGRMWKRLGIADVLGKLLGIAHSNSPSNVRSLLHATRAFHCWIGSRLCLLDRG